MIKIMMIALAVTMPIVVLFIHHIDQKDKIKANIGVSFALKKSRRNWLYKMFLFFHQFFLTKGYVDRVMRRYEILYPGEYREIAKKYDEHGISFMGNQCAGNCVPVFKNTKCHQWSSSDYFNLCDQ